MTAGSHGEVVIESCVTVADGPSPGGNFSTRGSYQVVRAPRCRQRAAHRSVGRALHDLPRLALHDLAEVLGVLGELGVAHQPEQRALAVGDALAELAGGGDERVELVERGAQ